MVFENDPDCLDTESLLNQYLDMEIVVVNKKREDAIKLPADATVLDLKKAFAKASKKDINRISFKQEIGDKTVRLDDNKKKISAFDISSGAKVIFKDLGPQIGYRTVFLVEYFGPLLLVGFYALRPAFIFGAEAASTPYNWVAKLGVICWMIHFLL